MIHIEHVGFSFVDGVVLLGLPNTTPCDGPDPLERAFASLLVAGCVFIWLENPYMPVWERGLRIKWFM